MLSFEECLHCFLPVYWSGFFTETEQIGHTHRHTGIALGDYGLWGQASPKSAKPMSSSSIKASRLL